MRSNVIKLSIHCDDQRSNPIPDLEGVCGPDGHSQAPRDGFMASLKSGIGFDRSLKLNDIDMRRTYKVEAVRSLLHPSCCTKGNYVKKEIGVERKAVDFQLLFCNF